MKLATPLAAALLLAWCGAAASAKCGIVFDFDGVIKRDDLGMSADIQGVVADVQGNSNMALGLATLSCTVDYVKDFLHSKVSSSAFTWDFLSSEAAQFCQQPKGVEVQRVQQHLGLPSACVLIYDDKWGNRQSVLERGMLFQHVRNTGAGILWREYQEGLSQLRAQGCGC